MFLDRYLLGFVHYALNVGIFLFHFIAAWSTTLSCIFSTKGRGRERRSRTNLPCDMEKVPRHLALLVLENHLSYKDIANLIVWSAEMGISYISLYDPNGAVKRDSKILEDLVRRKNQATSEQPILFHRRSSQDGPSLDSHDSTSAMRIAVLSIEDGRTDLVHTTQHIAKLIQNNQWQLSDIIPNKVDQLLQDRHCFPDPDLILRFGRISSLLGFLPWQIRLTEMLSLPTHRDLDYPAFQSALLKFSSLQQRFGK